VRTFREGFRVGDGGGHKERLKGGMRRWHQGVAAKLGPVGTPHDGSRNAVGQSVFGIES